MHQLKRLRPAPCQAEAFCYCGFAAQHRNLAVNSREVAPPSREIAVIYRDLAPPSREVPMNYRNLAAIYREVAPPGREVPMNYRDFAARRRDGAVNSRPPGLIRTKTAAETAPAVSWRKLRAAG